MGKAALHVGLCFLVLAELCAIISVFSPMHTLSFSVGDRAQTTKMTTYAWTSNFENPTDDFCILMQDARPGKKTFCGEAHVSLSLKDARERMCAPLTIKTFQGACDGVSSAFFFGLAYMIVVFCGIVASGGAMYIIRAYMTHTPKKQYRHVACYLIGGGLIAQFVVCLCYFKAVILYWKSLAKYPGHQVGIYLMWITIVFKAVALIFSKFGRTRLEKKHLQEQKFLQEQREFEADMVRANAELGGFNHGATNGGIGYGATHACSFTSHGSYGYGNGYCGYGSGYAGSYHSYRCGYDYGRRWQAAPTQQAYGCDYGSALTSPLLGSNNPPVPYQAGFATAFAPPSNYCMRCY